MTRDLRLKPGWWLLPSMICGALVWARLLGWV